MGETVLNYSRLKKSIMSIYIILLMAFSQSSGAETIKVCYDQWPPMTIFPDSDESRRGFVIDMMSQIYKDAGISLEFFEVPLARGLQMVKEGLCDVLPEYVVFPVDESEYVYAEMATFRYPSAFVVRHDDPWRYKGIQSVEGKRVATGKGWNYSSMSEAYQAYLDNPLNRDFVETVSGESDVVDRIMLMIIDGRVDLYADNIFVLQYVLKANGLSDKLKVVTPGLENRLIEKPIFSSELDPDKRARLIDIWDKGRSGITSEEEASLLKSYDLDHF